MEQAVAARMPPLAADGHRRDPAWRDGLAMLLDHFDRRPLPAPAAAAMASLRDRDADAVEALADGFLHGGVELRPTRVPRSTLRLRLQVYFTRLAAGLDGTILAAAAGARAVPLLRLDARSGVVTASGQTPGTRYLYCSLCSTAWNHVRAVCITCGQLAHAVFGGDRRRFRRGQGRDLRRVPHATRRCCTRPRTCRLILSRTILRRSGSMFWSRRRAGHATRPIRCCSSA